MMDIVGRWKGLNKENENGMKEFVWERKKRVKKGKRIGRFSSRKMLYIECSGKK
jgi:hypothetical protein